MNIALHVAAARFENNPLLSIATNVMQNFFLNRYWQYQTQLEVK